MADQAKSLSHRKSIGRLAIDTIRGRTSCHDKNRSNTSKVSEKNNSWDLFGSLRSAKFPIRLKQENGHSTARAQSSSPPKRGPLGIRLEYPNSPTPSPILKRRKSLGDMLHTLGRSTSRRDRASTISNAPSQPILKPQDGSPSIGEGGLTLPESAMEDYMAESSAARLIERTHGTSLHSPANGNSFPTSQSSSLPFSEDSVTTDVISEASLKSQDPIYFGGHVEESKFHRLSSEQSAFTTPVVPTVTKDSQAILEEETINEQMNSSLQRSPSFSYAELLNGEIPDWALDLDPDFKPRQAALNALYNSMLDRSDMQLLAGVDATLEFNDRKAAQELESNDHKDNLQFIIALTAAKMSKNFQLNSTPRHNPHSDRQLSGSESTALDDTSSKESLTRIKYNFNETSNSTINEHFNDAMWSQYINLPPISKEEEQSTTELKGKSSVVNNLVAAACLNDNDGALGNFSSGEDVVATLEYNPNPYMRGGHEPRPYSRTEILSQPNESSQILRCGARNTKRAGRVDFENSVSVIYPGGISTVFPSITDALGDIFAQEHLDLSDYCMYDVANHIIHTTSRFEQEPLHVLLQAVCKDKDLIWTPNFARLSSQQDAPNDLGSVTPNPELDQPLVSVVFHSKEPKGFRTEHLEYMPSHRYRVDGHSPRSNQASEDTSFNEIPASIFRHNTGMDDSSLVIGTAYPRSYSTTDTTSNASRNHTSSSSENWPLVDSDYHLDLVTSNNLPTKAPIRWGGLWRKSFRYSSFDDREMCMPTSSTQLPRNTADQTFDYSNESTDSQLPDSYEMPIEDSDNLRTYLRSDFSSSDQILSFTSKSPESPQQSKTNLVENNEDNVAYSLADTSFTEAPKTKNWLEMVREYKAARMAMRAEAVMGEGGNFSDPSRGSIPGSENETLDPFGCNSDFEGGAGSVEDNLLSDGEVDSDEFTKQLETVRTSEGSSSTVAVNSAISYPINLPRQRDIIKNLDQRLKYQPRRDSAVSFASGFHFSKYNNFGSSSELQLHTDTSCSASQDSKGMQANSSIEDQKATKILKLGDDKSWTSMSDASTLEGDDESMEVNGDAHAYRRTSTHQSMRLMTPSGSIHLPSTTIETAHSGKVPTPIQRTPTPHSRTTTPISHTTLTRRVGSPMGLPGLGLRATHGHLNPLMPFQNVSRVSSHELDPLKLNGNKTPPKKVVRRRRSQIENIKDTGMGGHAKALSIDTEVSEDFGTDLWRHEICERVDSGTEADDEEERGGEEPCPFWQDFFTSQMERFNKRT